MKPISIILIIASLSVGQIQNAAASSLHSLNTFGAFLGTGTASFSSGFGRFSGIVLPDNGVPQFSWNFTVPADHVVGNPILVGITWHTSAATPCNWVLSPNFISVARPGIAHIQGASASTGLSPLDGSSVLAANATDVSAAKYYIITSPDGVTQLQPLDIITFGLFRSAGSPQDTCTSDARVQGAWIYVL